ncbi:MAG: SWIM zinc finger family protein [Candidatus Thorarchaeota archaeon]
MWFNGSWHCTCQGFQIHMQGCRHISAVKEWIKNANK